MIRSVLTYLCLFTWLIPVGVHGQTFHLEVVDGYGSGDYPAGDTIHVWAANHNRQICDGWTGEVSFMLQPKEWTSVVIMPAKNISVQAVYQELTPEMRFTEANIRGADTIQHVWYYFPPQDQMRGVIWLFHGTNGSGSIWVNNIDNRQFSDYMMAHQYGLIAINSEESTLKRDLNGDGVYRWSYGGDTTLIDQANIRAIRDTFISRGAFTHATPMVAVGFSAGGAFTEFVANLFLRRAAFNHCTAGNDVLAEKAIVPYYHVINFHDEHPDVGPEANAAAEIYYQEYIKRGICADLEWLNPQPVYPERFARSILIDEQLSEAIYQELTENGVLDEKGYMKFNTTTLKLSVATNLALFPVARSLTDAQTNAVIDQLEACYAAHHFTVDFAAREEQFIRLACATSANQPVPGIDKDLLVYPNPVGDVIHVPGDHGDIQIYNLQGIKVLEGKGNTVLVSSLPAGCYLLRAENHVVKLLKN